MTPIEAIEKLGEAKGNAEALRMAKEALGKQIPRKPPVVGSDAWKCPTCETIMSYQYYALWHCACCGQALDWEMEK